MSDNQCVGGTCPVSPSTRTIVGEEIRGEGAYAVTRRSKEEVQSWWDHRATVTATVCNGKTFTRSEGSITSLFGDPRYSRLATDVVQTGNRLVITVSARKSQLNAADFEKSIASKTRQLLAWGPDRLSEGSYTVSSTPQQKITTSDVYDGVVAR